MMPSAQFRVLTSVIFAFCLLGVTGPLTGALLPDIMRSFSLTTTQAGILIAFWSLSFGIGSMISARMSEHFKLNNIFIFLSGLTLVVLLVLFQVRAFWLFGAAFGVFGAMMGSSETIGHTLIGVSFPGRRTSMLSVLDAVFTLGSVFAPLGVIAIASGGIDWRFFYLFLGIAFAILMAMLRFYLPATSVPKETKAEREAGFRSHVGMPYLVFLGLTGLFLGTIEWAQNSWIVIFVLDKNFSQFIAQMGLAFFLGGMLMVRILAIFIAGWMQHGRNSIYLLILALCGNLILLYGHGITSLMAGNFLIGFGTGAIFPIALGRAMDFNPKKAAIASSILLMGIVFGSQIAAVFLGWLADNSGGMENAFKSTTPLFFLLIVCYTIFRAKSRLRL
jgi:fucose permease